MCHPRRVAGLPAHEAAYAAAASDFPRAAAEGLVCRV